MTAIQTGIKLPPAVQALRDEIRILDRYVRQGDLTQDEAAARLDEWDIRPAPGMYRYKRLALLGVWDDDHWRESVLEHWKPLEREQKPQRNKEYRPPKSTIDTYRYLVREGDQVRLDGWLKKHPKDADFLRGLK
jgi:hypothetical protein